VASGREKMARLRQLADRICVLILSTDLPEIDILIERGKLRELCEHWFPGRSELFDMIYESRFDRLWEQFRNCRSSAGHDECLQAPTCYT